MLTLFHQKRILEEDADDEADVDSPSGYTHRARKPRLRRTSMARLIGVDLTDLELLSFFYHHSIVDILSANDERDKVWIQNTPSRVGCNPTIKKACLLLAAMDLAQRRAPAKYLINNEPHPKYKPLETKKDIQGYVPPTDKFQARAMVQFTKLLKGFQKSLKKMKLGDMEAYGDMMLSGTLVYITALAMGPLVPLINYIPGQGDMVGLSRSIRSVHETITGQSLTHEDESPYPILDNPERQYLPRERDLWETIEMAETREERLIMHKALHTLVEFYNMDIKGGCITHMTSWPIYWPHAFRDLQQAKNPYALIMLCYWCAYVHSFHGYSWWRDRAVEDLYTVVDELPLEYHYLVSWPLQVVQSFDVDADDYLTGKMQVLTF
ncbi:hypothetical protein CJU90_4455 [Yarrowia sp. C11]|nr:hypothetical protein CKK34_6736 [Yarrowia sp. E02]KAG5365377.1 hypothetical protein CJU90_4455 [Yarrowia sp. C11]